MILAIGSGANILVSQPDQLLSQFSLLRFKIISTESNINNIIGLAIILTLTAKDIMSKLFVVLFLSLSLVKIRPDFFSGRVKSVIIKSGSDNKAAPVPALFCSCPQTTDKYQ